jgi:hypothetical protein
MLSVVSHNVIPILLLDFLDIANLFPFDNRYGLFVATVVSAAKVQKLSANHSPPD